MLVTRSEGTSGGLAWEDANKVMVGNTGGILRSRRVDGRGET